MAVYRKIGLILFFLGIFCFNVAVVAEDPPPDCTPPGCEDPCELGNITWTDKDGCPRCKCNEEEKCEDLTETKCHLPLCKYGHEVDDEGCFRCKCRDFKDRPVTCKVECAKGIKGCFDGHFLDDRGCSTCKCRNYKCPSVRCCNSCPGGYQLDGNGCADCSCKGTCLPVSCPNSCEFGYRADANGCQTCDCKPECPTLDCLACTFGRILDSDGCETCQCKGKSNWDKADYRLDYSTSRFCTNNEL